MNNTIISTIVRPVAILLAVVSLLVVLTTATTHAVDQNPLKTGCAKSGAGGTAAVCQDVADDPLTGANGIVIKAAKLVSIAVGILSVIMIMLGGYSYIMSSGDPQRVSGAKNTILYAIIGLVVALLAQVFVAFVVSKTIT